ncbi:unnamed protein product, partial [Meganyctiphanes norvegica]
EENKKMRENPGYRDLQGCRREPMPQVALVQKKQNLPFVEVKCFCRRNGHWYNRMLECQRCKQWFHETCVGCLRYKLICGDRFYLYVCELCNNEKEFLHRLPIDWENIVHLAIWNLSYSKNDNKNYGNLFEYEEQITPWVNKHWELLQCPPEIYNIPVKDRAHYILLALQGNSNKFKCGKEVRKKTSTWALRGKEPPSVLEIILPPESPFTEELMHRISYCKRTTEFPTIHKTFKVDDEEPDMKTVHTAQNELYEDKVHNLIEGEYVEKMTSCRLIENSFNKERVQENLTQNYDILSGASNTSNENKGQTKYLKNTEIKENKCRAENYEITKSQITNPVISSPENLYINCHKSYQISENMAQQSDKQAAIGPVRCSSCMKEDHCNNRMVECRCCEKWFHGSCINLKLAFGDRFFCFVCKICNKGQEFYLRLVPSWENIAHLALYNLKYPILKDSTNYYFFEFETCIAKWINENWERIHCPIYSKFTISERNDNVLKALKGNSKLFENRSRKIPQNSKEFSARNPYSFWNLLVKAPPEGFRFIIPGETPIKASSVSKIKMYKDTRRFEGIPRNFNLDDSVLKGIYKY